MSWQCCNNNMRKFSLDPKCYGCGCSINRNYSHFLSFISSPYFNTASHSPEAWVVSSLRDSRVSFVFHGTLVHMGILFEHLYWPRFKIASIEGHWALLAQAVLPLFLGAGWLLGILETAAAGGCLSSHPAAGFRSSKMQHLCFSSKTAGLLK